MDEWSKEKIAAFVDEQTTGFVYFYTPMCGTCQVASKMIEITATLFPTIPAGKANLNYLEEIAEKYQIESVPCLLLFKEGQMQEKIYAFQSVPYLYEQLKSFLNEY